MTTANKIRSTEKVPMLDGFRGMAILLVLLMHCAVEFIHCDANSPKWMMLMQIYGTWLLRDGWMGVDAFFVLSGYLVGGIILDQHERPGFLQVFYVRRAFRILPLYLALIAAWLLTWSFHATPGNGPQGPPWVYAVFLQNFWEAWTGKLGDPFISPSWSLAVEAHFYMLAPFAVRWLGKSYKLLSALLLGLLSSMLIRAACDAGLGTGLHAAYTLTPVRMDGMIYGLLLAWGMRTEFFRQWLCRERWSLKVAAILSGAALLELSTLHGRSSDHLTYGFEMAFAGLFFALVLAVAVTRESWTAWFFSLPPLRLLGRYSYGIYLLHVPVILIALGYPPDQQPHLHTAAEFWQMCIGLGAAILIAVLSWHLFESKLIEMGHRWRYTRS